MEFGVEDLDDLGDMKVGAEELGVLTEDLETGIGDFEDWVWLDWFLSGPTLGFDLVAALLGELPVSLVSSTSSPPSSFATTPPADMGTEGIGQELGCLARTW